MTEKFDFNKIEKEKEFRKQPIKKTKEKIVFELKPEEKEFLDELLNNVYKAETREDRSDRIGEIIGIADKLIEAEAVEGGLTILDKVSEEELISFDDYTQAYLRNSKIDIFLKIADFWKKEGKIKDVDAKDKFKDIMIKINNDMSAIFSLKEQSVQDKNLARYALFMAEENKEGAYELFDKVKDKTPWLKELLDLNFQDLIQKQKAGGEMIEALAEIIEEAGKKKENKKEIRPEILDIANLKNYIRNQTNKFSPVLEKLLFAKGDIYSILATYADFKKNGYARQRNKNPDIFDKRFFLLQGKFDFWAYKLLRHQSFTFRENDQPYVSDEEFGGITNSLKEEKIKTILPYLEKGDLERNYELRKLVLEYIFGPNIERKKTKEKKKMSMEKYFENIDVKKRKELRENEPELYYQYVIYRYLKFLKWKYKAESFEDLAVQLEKDKNERALFLVKEFLSIKDKSFGKDEIKLAYIGKKKEIELHEDFYSSSRFNKFKQDMDVLEKRILEEAGTAEKIIEKVKNLGKNNICLAVPNRRMAWIYEHLLPHWENDAGLFKNEEDKMLFKLESAFLSQNFNLHNQDIHLPFATVMTAQKWLSEKKIDHFVYVFKGIKYASTPTVHDRKDIWSIGGRGFIGYVQTSPEFQEPAQSIFQREALRNIADFFVNIPIVFIDITKRSEPHSFEAFRAHIPEQDRCHLMSLNTGFFRDNVLELLGNDYWEALNYGHPNKGDIADWHYFKSEKIKTTKGKKLLGEYYIEKIQKNTAKA